MGAVLLPGLTVAPGPTAGAVGLGQGAKDRLAGQGQKPAEQGVAGPSRGRNRCHPLRLYRKPPPGPSSKCAVRSGSPGHPARKQWLRCLTFAPGSSLAGCGKTKDRSRRMPVSTVTRRWASVATNRPRMTTGTGSTREHFSASRRRPPQSPVPPRDTLARRFHTGPRRRRHDVSWSGCPESIAPRGWMFGSKSFPQGDKRAPPP